ncbi:hypothetical protein MBCUT_16170 [Methanobrevibacter cuticularis]|uniref:DUF4491 domain-containing protein n=1 Tax=Methanobrevibacter cuticularis TaxID=47311 RepID=A0A166D5W0_9EURY|nr:DUF4491 family protein [Methanobrevibacter cuticularis]KZX15238.1 hypothetical protein MBCUT_16170 [Methanobrevibacter cuticularis]
MNLEGVIIGLGALLIIGLLHPVVIKGEYHIGKKIWPIFLFGGIVSIIISLFIETSVISALIGVFGFSLLWSIHEISQQEKRVEKGWFPSNPKKKK